MTSTMTAPLDEKGHDAGTQALLNAFPMADKIAAQYAEIAIRAYLAASPLSAQVQRLTEEKEALRVDAARYAYLRDRDLDTIHNGGVFAGSTPENVVINGADLDQYIDDAMANAGGLNAPS